MSDTDACHPQPTSLRCVNGRTEALCGLVEDLSGVRVLGYDEDSIEVQLATHQGGSAPLLLLLPRMM